MAATVIGKLITINTADATGGGGTIEFALCGYGSRTPQGRGIGASTGSIATPQLIQPALGDSTFSVTLIGNDVIQPAGTYYAVTIRDANGDVVQCNAYVFFDGQSYDLDFQDPFDPTNTPQPLPPLMFSQLVPVPAAAQTVLPGNKGSAFYVLVTLPITQLVIQSPVLGILYTIVLQQDGTGNHPVTPDNSFENFGAVKQTANGTTTQTVVCLSAARFNAIAPAMWS